MKLEYMEAEMEIVYFEVEDIITASDDIEREEDETPVVPN